MIRYNAALYDIVIVVSFGVLNTNDGNTIPQEPLHATTLSYTNLIQFDYSDPIVIINLEQCLQI